MKKKILVADDSITIQKVIQLSFPEDEYEVICVSNGREALEKLESFSPDLILADAIMPETDGYALCKSVKASKDLSHIPVLMLVGSFEPFNEEDAEQSGADGIITKPFDRVMLVEKVKRTLQPELAESAHQESSFISSTKSDADDSSLEDFPISLDKDSVIDLSTSLDTAQEEAKKGETKSIRLTNTEIETIAKKLIEFMPKNLLGDIIKASITEVAEKIIKEKIKELEDKTSE